MTTQPEQEAFIWMQGRMVELLMRHDLKRFHKNFGERQAALFDDERHKVLHPYRELAVLVFLRDELFGSILPRIKRRLSFLAPRELVVEELPPRGRIDWPGTMTASLRDLPGEAPLEVQTRQRRRHFATPENLLTVTTILEYRAAVQRHLDAEAGAYTAHAMSHPLQGIVETCSRELAFPQFTGLVRRCEAIAEGYADETSADLEHVVEANLLPGRNNAYDDLIAWRRQLDALRLLDRDSQAEVQPMLGAEPARDNYLYQLWLFYELAELLGGDDCVEEWQAGSMSLRFHWGKGEDSASYRLQHDQSIPHHWDQAPGVRPDLFIERVDRQEVVHDGELIWREPGFVLDAKYYKPRDSARAPSGPVKRMVADLHLTGERYGALLFAFQSVEPPQDDDDADVLDKVQPLSTVSPIYRVSPRTAAAQVARPDATIAIWRVQPSIERPEQVHVILRAVLDEAHRALRKRVPVACHGVFLDALSLAERGTLLGRDDTALVPDDLLACPKPHIGSWRVDLVSRGKHCCSDGHLCHIISQPGAAPPVRPPRNPKELLKELDRLFETGAIEALDEEAVENVISRIEGLTRRFAEITGALQDLGRYEAKLGDIGLDRTLHLLGPIERESLALAIYLRDQLDDVKANDYSASIIHVARVLERELQRRILAVPGVRRSDFPHGKPTLGTLGGVRRRNPLLWRLITTHLGKIWVSQVDPRDPKFRVTIEDLIDEVELLVRERNKAAHTTPIPRGDFREILRSLCDGGPLRVGSLNALLIAWPAP